MIIPIISAMAIQFSMVDADVHFRPKMPPLSARVPWRIERVEVIGGDPTQEMVANYAYAISGSMEFVYLLKAENGEMTYRRRHPKARGSTGTDWGLCGVNDHYQKKIINDRRFFLDWMWQVRKCKELWEGGTTFYGKKHIPDVKKYFIKK